MLSFREKLKTLHRRAALPELILALIWIYGCALIISPGAFKHTARFMLQNPLLIFLNALPVAVVLLVVYFLSSNALIAGGVANLLFSVLNYINLLKIEGRDDPFVPADIALLREAVQATGDYHLNMHPALLAMIFLSTAVMIGLGIWLGKSKKPALPVRILGIGLALAVFFTCFFTLYRDRGIYAAFPVSSHYNVTSIFNELGFHYCFLYNYGLYTPEKPDNYSKAAIEGSIHSFTPGETPEGTHPHILMIMCEAFSDLLSSDHFTYAPEEHPLRDYYTVLHSDNSFSGRIVVPNYGAGTANTEFDVLTGMQTNLINHTSNSAMRSFNKDISSLPRVLSGVGYDTFFMHPGYSWFYNRHSALNHMGITDTVFLEQLENKSNMDDVFLENLTRELEKRADGEKPLFTYATTIQNHQAYTYGKYDYALPELAVDTPLSEDARELLTVYAYGIQCSSRMLLELTEYLNDCPEPYILVFFGDHLPNLGANYLAYRELGMGIGLDSSGEDLVDTCTIPYIIWMNDAYLAGRGAETLAAGLELPADGRISASYLGQVTLELAGFREVDPYFSYLAQLRREIPVIKQGVYSVNGQLTGQLTPDQQAAVDKMHWWQFYRMTEERVSH